ncbi:uncharacterized, partial [Tachysurus ichikawai]
VVIHQSESSLAALVEASAMCHSAGSSRRLPLFTLHGPTVSSA